MTLYLIRVMQEVVIPRSIWSLFNFRRVLL